MIKLLLDLTISVIFLSRIKCKIVNINMNEEQTSWMDKPWLSYVGVILSVAVSIIESVGNTIIKKSHIIYEKYKKHIERKELTIDKIEENYYTNVCSHYSNRTRKGETKKKRYSFLNISIMSTQIPKNIYTKKVLCNKFLFEKKKKKRNKKENENEDNNSEKEKEIERDYDIERKLNKKNTSEVNELESLIYIYSKSNRKLRKVSSFQSLLMESDHFKDEFNVIKDSNGNYNTSNYDNNNNSNYKNIYNKNFYSREINKKFKRKGRFLKSLKNSNYSKIKKMKTYSYFYGEKKENYNYISNFSYKKNKFKKYIKKNKNYKNIHKFYKKFKIEKSPSHEYSLKDIYTLQDRNNSETLMWKDMNFDSLEQLTMHSDDKDDIFLKSKKKNNTMMTILNNEESRTDPNITNFTNEYEIYYSSFPPHRLVDNRNSKVYRCTDEKIHEDSFYASKSIGLKKMYSEKKCSDEEVTRSSTFHIADENYINKLKKKSYFYFYLGIIFTSIVAPSFNIFSNALLPASMVGFTSIRLICSLLLEKFVLKETQSFYLYIGIPFATIGLILITIFSGKDSQFNDLDYIFKLFLKIESILLMASELLFTYSVAFFSIKYFREKKKKKNNFLFIFSPFSSGILGSLSTILCKALVIGFMSTVVKDNFRFFQFFLNYKLIILNILTSVVALTEIFYTPYLLKHYHLTHVVSLKSFGNIVFNAVNGMLIFNERPSCIYAWAFGFFLVLIGITFLSCENVIPYTINYLKLYCRRPQ